MGGKRYTSHELHKLIDAALWDITEFREVVIDDFEDLSFKPNSSEVFLDPSQKLD